MNRTFPLAAFALFSMLTMPLVFAQEADKETEKPAEKQSDNQAEKSAAETLKENPDDAAALSKHFNEVFGNINRLSSSDPDAAEKVLDEASKLLDSLEPEEARAKQLVASARRAVGVYRDRIVLARTTVDELKTKLTDNPDDTQTISQFSDKVLQSLASTARSEPDKAEQQLKEATSFLDSLAEKSEQEGTKTAIERAKTNLARIERSIESGKKLAAVIGKEAAPLSVEAWANGAPLTEEDLKGKVVLLDFWAVWCGPCIATFPHLREWQEKYADKGLVIIGLTRHYNYQWNEEAGRPQRSTAGDVPKETELEMLEKFAESHNLHHRFAIQSDGSMSDYYAVSGIPHVVVIDQEQKVRLMRVGSGEANAHDVEEMIKQLLGQTAATESATEGDTGE